MFIGIPDANETSPRVDLTGEEIDELVEEHGLKVYWTRGRRLLLTSDLFRAIHGAKSPKKFASILSNYPSRHEDLKPDGIDLVVSKIHSTSELTRYLRDLDRHKLFLTFTRETVNIYQDCR
tara:strand:- start:1378 stop:1740 length:363 start_codon:yes stop_codon:yes gene_type:complete